MADIVEFDFFFAEANHEGARVELHVLAVDGARQDIVMVEVLPLLLGRLRWLISRAASRSLSTLCHLLVRW